jgi:hypothetical protein
MTNTLLKVALALIIAIAISLLFIHAQVFDDSGLRAFLTPPDSCPAPCFMGIRPGVTTREEVIAILERNDWIGTVDTENPSYISWTWSGSQPSIIAQASKGTLYVGGDDSQQQIVRNVSIETTLPIAYMYLLKGEPTATDSGAGGLTSEAIALGVYFDNFIMISAYLTCPVTLKHFWDAPMRITIMNKLDMHSMTGFSHIDFFC